MSEPAREGAPPSPRVLARPEHALSRAAISPNALKVLYRLHGAGFTAYLVGGAVRDLLLGRTPKDFDVGTNARPQQVRQLFRNARVIGRRFRLVLIRFADEIVEVATFRRSPEPPEIEEGEPADVLAPTPEAEEFGTPDEDAWRRDFTVNGLFYNIADFSVIDHVGGLDDLAARVIRTIGAPRQRFAEDPVRMMRAVEYAARLGFRIDEELREAIAEMRGEIRRAAPARIAYELLESLKGGHAAAIFRGLEQAGLLEHVVPEAATQGTLPWALLDAADARVRRGEPLREETLLALLFLPRFLAGLEAAGGRVSAGDVERLAREQLAEPVLRLAFSHFRGHLIRSAFLLLWRMLSPPRSPKVALRAARHEAFPTARELANLLAGVAPRWAAALAGWGSPAGQGEPALQPPALAEATVAPPTGERRRPRRRRGGRRRRRAGEAS